MSKTKIVVLGGYGNLGRRICEFLAEEESDFSIVIAGRSEEKAQALAIKLREAHPLATLSALLLDWHAQDFASKLKETEATILIHCAGPFQEQDYTVANLCIDLKIHYLDLADGRDFVANISTLNEAALANEVIVISGASTLPGLSSVVIDAYANQYALLNEIQIGVAPGNKITRSNAGIASVLGYFGQPFQRLENGQWKTVYGWQNIHQHYYGDNIGLRWQGSFDVPDLALLPEKYPTLKTVVFHSGLEITWLHWLLWHLSWLTRIKIIKNWKIFQKFFIWMNKTFEKGGTDIGGMYIYLYGSNFRYQPLEIKWLLVAEQGDGANIPIIPCVILVKKILQGKIPPGSKPCLCMFNLAEFDKIASKWHVYQTVEEKEF